MQIDGQHTNIDCTHSDKVLILLLLRVEIILFHDLFCIINQSEVGWDAKGNLRPLFSFLLSATKEFLS